mmetsp:Transcript_36064/g.66651  ORF Transcript_36064/g.66651 Transcript_36064/m.66651 type:complete len:207 (+) Transcript_36064:366-986(+)
MHASKVTLVVALRCTGHHQAASLRSTACWKKRSHTSKMRSVVAMRSMEARFLSPDRRRDMERCFAEVSLNSPVACFRKLGVRCPWMTPLMSLKANLLLHFPLYCPQHREFPSSVIHRMRSCAFPRRPNFMNALPCFSSVTSSVLMSSVVPFCLRRAFATAARTKSQVCLLDLAISVSNAPITSATFSLLSADDTNHLSNPLPFAIR